MISLLMKELQITGAIEYPVEFPAVIEMLSRKWMRPMISHSFPLSRFNEAFAQAQKQNEALKVPVDRQSRETPFTNVVA
ncbi:MAG: hypothetical protein IPK95_13680 [Cellvibrionales bacterium]|nr:hypothetical protein [Cellvibrionales bacterium]